MDSKKEYLQVHVLEVVVVSMRKEGAIDILLHHELTLQHRLACRCVEPPVWAVASINGIRITDQNQHMNEMVS